MRRNRGEYMKNLKKLTILHSNDMHGDFLAEQIDERLVGGVSLLSGYVNKVRREEKNVIYAIAGDMFRGSVIDSAKAIANGACIEEDVWELFVTKRPNPDVLPIAVVLTIPAAGSEASKNTVVSNDELGMKTGYGNDAQRPKLAFLNPELTFTLPPFATTVMLW